VEQDNLQWQVLVSAVMNIRITKRTGNFFTSWATTSFWRTLLHEVAGVSGLPL